MSQEFSPHKYHLPTVTENIPHREMFISSVGSNETPASNTGELHYLTNEDIKKINNLQIDTGDLSIKGIHNAIKEAELADHRLDQAA